MHIPIMQFMSVNDSFIHFHFFSDGAPAMSGYISFDIVPNYGGNLGYAGLMFVTFCVHATIRHIL